MGAGAERPSHKLDANGLLPGLPVERIHAAYSAAPGNEIESRKFFSPESSAALAANAFGFFLGRASLLPPLPDTEDLGWPAVDLTLETTVRFPWAGGHHPCLDALITTDSALIGVESKRYEPFRARKATAMSNAYWRDVWGAEMKGYSRIRDSLRDAPDMFRMLDARQLVKHAFGLRSAVHRKDNSLGFKPVLFYLYAEPKAWPGAERRTISEEERQQHRMEVAEFAELVSGDEVAFRSCSYAQLLGCWRASDGKVRDHADAVAGCFDLA